MSDKEVTAKIQPIADQVSLMMGLSVNDIKSQSRLAEFVQARALICMICRRPDYYIPLKSIGKFLGNRTHATIMNAVEYGEAFLGIDRHFKRNHDNIIRNLTNG